MKEPETGAEGGVINEKRIARAERFIFRRAAYVTIGAVALLWLVKAMEMALHTDFGGLGIRPLTLEGAFGIITGPLVHGNMEHLLSNSFPLMVVLMGTFYLYYKVAFEVLLWIYFGTGFWVWVVARDASHIGASGVVYGLVAFLFFMGLFRKDVRSLAISLIILLLYSGMVEGLFPTREHISYESHRLGAVAGLFCAVVYRNTPSWPDVVSKLHKRLDDARLLARQQSAETELMIAAQAASTPMLPERLPGQAKGQEPPVPQKPQVPAENQTPGEPPLPAPPQTSITFGSPTRVVYHYVPREEGNNTQES